MNFGKLGAEAFLKDEVREALLKSIVSDKVVGLYAKVDSLGGSACKSCDRRKLYRVLNEIRSVAKNVSLVEEPKPSKSFEALTQRNKAKAKFVPEDRVEHFFKTRNVIHVFTVTPYPPATLLITYLES